ncbi:MAG: S24/S26 family peptidase [Bacteroidales bacterium]|nr:S24/S26 family peptidase [Bacteroidales bacterium]MCM1147718.1 S24/S26 family peptidase [Bacteroidales bacterium]MCM1206672.1 S24/S26 family peptidase [Bacillota bacterium]MCM1510587.1 S24/S26 family peptidase [Clostridium sp.]
MKMNNAALIPAVAQLLQEGRTVIFPLRGNSMRPFLIHKRDKALLVLPEKVRIGDPVLAEVSPSHYVLHRVVGIDGDRITLRGDGNLATEQCRRENVVALAVGFYRKGRATLDGIESRKWRLYSMLWMQLLPLRRYLLKLHDILFHSQKPLND